MLDQLEDRGPIRHLRALLIDAHVLPPTDVRLRAHEAWVQQWRASTPCASAVIQYVSWSHVKRIRKAAQVSLLTPAQVANARSELKALDHLELWLQALGKTITTMSQHELDAYSSVARTVPLRAFFSWAEQALNLNLHVPIPRRTDPASVISEGRGAHRRRIRTARKSHVRLTWNRNRDRTAIRARERRNLVRRTDRLLR